MSAFIPPFCPWKGCGEHRLPSSARPYQACVPWGSYPTKAFSLDYYAKRVVDYQDVSRRLSSCESLRAIGRKLGLSCDSVSNRISRASRQAIAAESRLAASRHPDEDLAAEGFESFWVSQFFPANIHLPEVRGGLSGGDYGEEFSLRQACKPSRLQTGPFTSKQKAAFIRGVRWEGWGALNLPKVPLPARPSKHYKVRGSI